MAVTRDIPVLKTSSIEAIGIDRAAVVEPIEPTEFQRKIIDCSIDLVLLGGRGGGKTFGLAQKKVKLIQKYGADYHGLFVRKTFSGVRDFEAISRRVFRSLIPGASYNQTSKIWTFPNGATYEINQLEHVRHYDKFQGRSFTDIDIDECGQWDSPILLDLLVSNLRGKPGIPLTRNLLANPGGRGHGWIRRRYIDNCAAESPTLEPESEREVMVLHSTYLDNPTIDREGYLKSLNAATATDMDLRKAFVAGDWTIARGAFFSTVLDAARSKVPAWRSIPAGWTSFLGMDYGTAAPCAIYLAVESGGGEWEGKFYPRGSIVLVDELYLADLNNIVKGANLTIEQQAQRIIEFCDLWGISPLSREHTADDACFSNDGRQSIAELFLKAGVRFKRAQKGDRITGWEILRQLMLQAGMPDKPGLYVSDSCKYFWQIMPYVARDERCAWDVDTNGNDHIADVARYICLRAKSSIVLPGLKIY